MLFRFGCLVWAIPCQRFCMLIIRPVQHLSAAAAEVLVVKFNSFAAPRTDRVTGRGEKAGLYTIPAYGHGRAVRNSIRQTGITQQFSRGQVQSVAYLFQRFDGGRRFPAGDIAEIHLSAAFRSFGRAKGRAAH